MPASTLPVTTPARNVVSFDRARLKVALRRLQRESGAGMSNFLKMEKSGEWVYGVDAEPVSDEDEFLIDPRAFQHGYIAWEANNVGNKLGEVMGPLDEEIPELGPVPDGSNGWQFQLGLGLVMRANGTPVVFRSTSVGGKRAIGNVGQELWVQAGDISDAEALDGACVPVVRLSSDSYMHRKYGRIFNPVITVVEWTTLDALDWLLANGASLAAQQPEPQPAPAKKAPLRVPKVPTPPVKAPAKGVPPKPGKAR